MNYTAKQLKDELWESTIAQVSLQQMLVNTIGHKRRAYIEGRICARIEQRKDLRAKIDRYMRIYDAEKLGDV